MDILKTILSAAFIFTIIRLTTPIIFATLSAIISTKAGVTNIATEGIMLICALTSVIVSATTQSVIISLISAVVIGALLGIGFILLVLKLKSNPILTGLAINIIASGGTVFWLWLLTGDKGASTSLRSLNVPQIKLPFINEIPYIGQAISNHSALTYIAFLCVLLIYILLYRTSLGLRIRAVGENRNAAKSVGVNADRVQIISLAISGALAGLGGAFMSMGYLSWFSTNMVAGRGFIGLAAEAMGKGTPLGGLIVSLFFGFADALANLLQTNISVPAELIQMLPYLSTIIGLGAVSYIVLNKSKKRENGR